MDDNNYLNKLFIGLGLFYIICWIRGTDSDQGISALWSKDYQILNKCNITIKDVELYKQYDATAGGNIWYYTVELKVKERSAVNMNVHLLNGYKENISTQSVYWKFDKEGKYEITNAIGWYDMDWYPDVYYTTFSDSENSYDTDYLYH